MIFTLLLTNAVWAGPVEQIGFGARSMVAVPEGKRQPKTFLPVFQSSWIGPHRQLGGGRLVFIECGFMTFQT